MVSNHPQMDKEPKGRMTMKLLITLALAATLATPALAEHAEEMGVGLSPCADFTKMSKGNPATELMFYSWAQGFISAANRSRLMQGGDSANVAAMSSDEQTSRLRSYCKAHPLEEYMYAVADLINRMPTNPGSAAAAKAEAEALEK